MYKPLFGLHENHRGVNYNAMHSMTKKLTTATNAATVVVCRLICVHGVCNYYSDFNGKITCIYVVRYRRTKRFMRLPTKYGYLLDEWKMKDDQKCKCADHIRTVWRIADERYNRKFPMDPKGT